jgi:hypothetical protein
MLFKKIYIHKEVLHDHVTAAMLDDRPIDLPSIMSAVT